MGATAIVPPHVSKVKLEMMSVIQTAITQNANLMEEIVSVSQDVTNL